MIKICVICDCEFATSGDTPNEKRKKYCSDACRKEAVKRQKKRGYHNLICVVCGKVFLSDRRDRVCCSVECSHERNKITARERFKRKYYEEKAEREEAKVVYAPPKRRKIASLQEIDAEARKRGMSYGRYMALLQMEKERAERERMRNGG